MEILYRPDWPEARQRLEAWWQGEIVDRVPIMVTAPKRELPSEPEPKPEEMERYWTDPAWVVPRMEKLFSATFYGGEAIPVFLPNLGPTSMSAYLGCPVHLQLTTVWQEPIITDWNNPPSLEFDPNNKWWQATLALTKTAVEASAGRYFVALSDIGANADAISYLRGPAKLCQDLVDYPEAILELERKLAALWYQLYDQLYAIIHSRMDGSSGWMGIWAPGKTYPLQCDFSCMISPEMFRRFFLPSIEEQARWLDCSIYHLDGPGAIQHLDSLLEIPKINAIQWVPGAGAPPAVQWMPLLKRIQQAGKGLYIRVDKEDIEAAMAELSPKGLLIRTACDSEEEARTLLKNVARWTAKHL